MYIPELIKIDKLKSVLKNLDNLFLKKLEKMGNNIKNLKGNLTLYILFFFPASMGLGLLGLALAIRYRCGGNYNNSDL